MAPNKARNDKVATMASFEDFFAKLESTLSNASPEQRTQTMLRIGDFFVKGAERYNDEQIARFDYVLSKYAGQIEAAALAKIASEMSAIPNAPRSLIRRCAFHDDVLIAGPILARSPRVSEPDLLTCATAGTKLHLLAITERSTLSEQLTDVILKRGDGEVFRSVAKNSGANFSDFGFGTLVGHSRQDDILASSLGARADVPRQYLVKLIEEASELVREKLSKANPKIANLIREVVSSISKDVRAEVRESSLSYAAARDFVGDLFRKGMLNEAAIAAFAGERKFEETLVGLCLLCRIDVDTAERAISGSGAEGALLLSKLAGMSWDTTRAIIYAQHRECGIASQDVDRAFGNFARMNQDTARRILAFKVRAKPPAAMAQAG